MSSVLSKVDLGMKSRASRVLRTACGSFSTAALTWLCHDFRSTCKSAVLVPASRLRGPTPDTAVLLRKTRRIYTSVFLICLRLAAAAPKKGAIDRQDGLSRCGCCSHAHLTPSQGSRGLIQPCSGKALPGCKTGGSGFARDWEHESS